MRHSLVLRCVSCAVRRILVLALLKLDADRLVLVEVLLLALDVAVHDHAAVIAVDLAGGEADGAHSEVRADIFSCGYFVWHQALVVHGVRVGSELHKELSNVLSATHGCEMQRSIAIVIGDIGLCSMPQQKLQDFVTRVVSGSLE